MSRNVQVDIFGKGWATPVTSKRWAFIATVLHRICRLTGYRLLGHQKHVAWLKSVGRA